MDEVIEESPAVPTEYTPAKDAGTRGWQTRIRHRAKTLADQVEMGYLELGEILYRIYDAPVDGDPKNGSVLAKWGYGSIGEYAERELGIHSSKAQRLMRIFYRIEVELNGLDGNYELKRRFCRLGWSKAKELIRILTKENAAYWVENAEVWNYATVIERIKMEYQRREREAIQKDLAERPNPVEESNRLDGGTPVRVREDDDSLKWITKTYRMESSQAETVNLAIQRAQDLAGNIKKSPSSLLSLICLDFLSNADWKGGDLDSKLRFLAKIEQSLGLRLVVVDDTDEVVYGLRALESAAVKMRESAEEPSND
jgi:hypothetical protein